MIKYDVKFITCDESLSIKNTDLQNYKYETKKRSEESVFDQGKRDYAVRRGGHWRAPHPRRLKQLESILRDHTVVKATWIADNIISIVFSSGTIAYLTVKLQTIDVTHILFDRYFVGKLAGSVVTNVAICKSHMLFTHSDKTATLACFGKTSSVVPCRISDREPSLHCIELGGVARRTERLLSSCDSPSGARVLVWSVAGAEPAPWSPVSAIEDLANLHLYQINGSNVSLIAYHQLEGETLCAELSQNDDVIHIVEQLAHQKNGVKLEWSCYEIPVASRAVKLGARAGPTRVALAAPARLVRRARGDSRLLVACIDGSLHVVHRGEGLMRSVKAGFIASEVVWAGELVVWAEGGALHAADRALQPLARLDRREGRRLQILCSSCVRGGCVLLGAGAGAGPLALLRLSHPDLITAWVAARRLPAAVALLRAMDWRREGARCLAALARLLTEALRTPHDWGSRSAAAVGALGAFLAREHAAPPHLAPPVLLRARKLFHHLLRRGRMEAAMSLGVDLRAWDLFVDARCAAARLGLPALRREAAAAAAALISLRDDQSESSECCSSCSSPAPPPPPPPPPRGLRPILSAPGPKWPVTQYKAAPCPAAEPPWGAGRGAPSSQRAHKNKVKFSDTVTIAVVAAAEGGPPAQLYARAAGTLAVRDYVEV